MRTKTKTEELIKTSAIAVPGENGFALVHIPRSLANKRVWILNQAAYDDLKAKKTI
jgi:hypothetical protein